MHDHDIHDAKLLKLKININGLYLQGLKSAIKKKSTFE